MDAGDRSSRQFASVEDIREAIEALSDAELLRIRAVARRCLLGTQFDVPDDLAHQAIDRAMAGAQGKGRRWPLDVPFVAFLIQSMKSIADDSRNSLAQSGAVELESLDTPDASQPETTGGSRHAALDEEHRVIAEEQDELVKRTLASIQAHFADDEDVTWLILCIGEAGNDREAKRLTEWDDTRYATVRRRFNRGLNKLFPERSKR